MQPSTYSLHDAFACASLGDGTFSVWVDKLGHRRRAHEQGEAAVNSKHRGLWFNSADVPQHSGSEPYPIETGLVGIPSDKIGCRTVVERPGLLAGCL